MEGRTRGKMHLEKRKTMKAYAKINISLDIIGKQENGYHLLEMVMQTVDLYDEITIEEREEGITLDCNLDYIPKDSKNIAYKAAAVMLERFGIDRGVHITILKRIPVAAGLAGGSTNAAAVIKGMNDLFGLGLSREEMMEIGLTLGADVPYCIVGGTALCTGIGEVVKPLQPFSGVTVLLVKPAFGVSTKDAYMGFALDKVKKHVETAKLIKAMERRQIRSVAYYMRNLLENVTLRKHPILKTVKSNMMEHGAVGTLMSGSGPTVFGIFEDDALAEIAEKFFREKYREVYLTRTISV